MLSDSEMTRLRAEEVYRREVRNALDKRGGFSQILGLLNQPFVLWVLTLSIGALVAQHLSSMRSGEERAAASAEQADRIRVELSIRRGGFAKNWDYATRPAESTLSEFAAERKRLERELLPLISAPGFEQENAHKPNAGVIRSLVAQAKAVQVNSSTMPLLATDVPRELTQVVVLLAEALDNVQFVGSVLTDRFGLGAYGDLADQHDLELAKALVVKTESGEALLKGLREAHTAHRGATRNAGEMLNIAALTLRLSSRKANTEAECFRKILEFFERAENHMRETRKAQDQWMEILRRLAPELGDRRDR